MFGARWMPRVTSYPVTVLSAAKNSKNGCWKQLDACAKRYPRRENCAFLFLSFLRVLVARLFKPALGAPNGRGKAAAANGSLPHPPRPVLSGGPRSNCVQAASTDWRGYRWLSKCNPARYRQPVYRVCLCSSANPACARELRTRHGVQDLSHL